MLNEVNLIGYLSKDAESRKIDEKNYVIRFTVGTKSSYKKKDGNQVEETEWHDCEYWRETENLLPYLTKGTPLFVKGSIKTDTFTGQDGQKRYFKKIKVAKIEFFGNGSPSSSQPTQNTPAVEEHEDMPF